MSTPDDLTRLRSEIDSTMREHWVAFLVEGIVLVVLGLLALLAPMVASVAATLLFGAILLVSSVCCCSSACRARRCGRSVSSLQSTCSSAAGRSS